MFKTFEEWLKLQKIPYEEYEALSEIEKGEYAVQYNNYLREKIQDQITQSASKKDLDAMKGELVSFVADQMGPMLAQLKKQGVEITKMKYEGGSAPKDVESFRDVVKAAKDDIISVAKTGTTKDGKEKYVVIKATTTRASVANNINAFELPEIGQLATRRLSAYEIFPKFTLPAGYNGQIKYIDWDEATKVRAAAMIAEGATFPESTAAWQQYTLPLKKVGDLIPWTDEFEYDDNFLVSELAFFLNTNVDLIIDNQIVNGDNTGQNLRGLVSSTVAYVPVASGITDASIYDLLVKVKEDITKTGGGKYNPDVAMMNITTINQFKLKKDGENNYIMPPFVSADGRIVDGLVVIESNIVPDNVLYVGERRFGRIYETEGVNMERGYINTDFADGIQRMKMYRRLLFLIREADQSGWRRVTDISAALATLAT